MMTDLEGMHSYFWLTSSRLREPVQDDVPYTTQALRQDLLRVRSAWNDCQTSRARNAIYGYLTAVFDLVMWWAAEGRAISRARWALQLHHLDLPTTDEPFAAVISCTADRNKVDKRTRSKWSRVLRYSAEYKAHGESLAAFIQRKGGINKCAARFTCCSGEEIWEQGSMRAADVMTTDVVTVGPDAHVVEVAETLLASRISAVPVVGERGELVGIERRRPDAAGLKRERPTPGMGGSRRWGEDDTRK
jgi:hypothetical protein